MDQDQAIRFAADRMYDAIRNFLAGGGMITKSIAIYRLRQTADDYDAAISGQVDEKLENRVRAT